ncbi:hypothetical protein EPO34_02620 [Patescibacteria group bacterium]|nr:MAG: hypothetical protein EPO34_02620 [Patescibacteria group bacterium]
MKTRHRIVQVLVAAATLVVLVACGTIKTTRDRYAVVPYDEKEFRQEKDGLIVEFKPVDTYPPELIVNLASCSETYQQQMQRQKTGGEAPREDVLILDPRRGEYFSRVTVTNTSDHVVRMTTGVFKLFDPANNANDAMTKDDIVASIEGARSCANTAEATAKARNIKLFDRAVELVPNSSFSGWIVFKVAPEIMSTPGTWKVALYELPIAVDDAGKVTKTTRFEIRSISKKFVDRYEQANMFAAPQLVGTDEVTQ